MKRIGFYGGSFDPIHNAHLHVARQAIDLLNLNTVLFMPSGGTPYYKEGHQPAEPRHRLQMVHLALTGEPRFDVSDYEIQQGTFCYTIDTLQYLKSVYPPDTEILLLAGSDWKDLIPQWKEGDKLLDEFRVVLFARPGTHKERTSDDHPNMEYIDIPMLDISSSLVRERIQSGERIDDLVPQAVNRYIHQQGLYQKSDS